MLQKIVVMPIKREKLIVVSNRLPFAFQREPSGHWRTVPGEGGLVTALLPVLRHRGGTWIGWPGASESVPDLSQELDAVSEDAGYALRGVALTAEEVRGFYEGFANEVIWPLFHDMHSLCNFDPEYWHMYCAVNRKFAYVVHEASSPEDFIWVHDYHLMNVAAELRRLGVESRIGFFLHTPFPPLDIFLKLPWRMQLLEALLEYDLVGLQTVRDRHNFTQCVCALFKDASIEGRGQVLLASARGRTTRIGAFPISIDYKAFMQRAASEEVTTGVSKLHMLLPNRKLILGIDRLDYTKGIPLRLKAFHNVLTRYPELRECISLIQVVVPSREDVAGYRDLKSEIEQLSGKINGTFARPGGWVPVWYIYRSLSRLDLLAYYRAADIALITPLKDGMNLVAKEYCACSIEEDCVLILSEFAGAAVQLAKGALLVNPYDIEGVADAIRQAYQMEAAERHGRMHRLRRQIREHDVFWWVDAFLRAAITKKLDAFPLAVDHRDAGEMDFGLPL
ncbi:MAG TPA: trehalose-6-phosphate synthase [Syntrophales bacterium]|nr:trehalose-6-phosphate synthase [Syntrophales bacterium]HPI57794.1 trehalose-6-phosphate synthase [Syntrophales bacterium]HPN25507.1 trehalose-6-phosphate synthase [Syntrophales bacterium]HQM28453.1 trehalose-6-phosphate synthase [Syntrophales bacterium]